MRSYLLSIGIMTGNSLDGADFVLSKFSLDGQITDLNSLSLKYPEGLVYYLRRFRDEVSKANGKMIDAINNFNANEANNPFQLYNDLITKEGKQFTFEILDSYYSEFLASGVKKLIKESQEKYLSDPLPIIDIIGSHGQTCGHFPPSIAKTKDPSKIYTIQIGSGQKLADLTGITVAYDFRSDDIMNGGEGAPLAPIHHWHLASITKKSGNFPLAFCNGGNTGNLSIISQDRNGMRTLGFDTGPFNHLPDLLMRREQNLECDTDGKIGSLGKVNLPLLELLFENCVVTKDGDNFLLKNPPKSSDPEWYRAIPELLGEKPINGSILSFEDRLRTAEYFSAYIFYFALSKVPEDIEIPSNFATCGGGWKNPIITQHFSDLVYGNLSKSPLITTHQPIHQSIRDRLIKTSNQIKIEKSEYFGFDGTAMEARIFADAAVCLIRGEPFTTPETTGTSKPTICGILAFPNQDTTKASPVLTEWLSHFKTLTITPPQPYSRASK